MGCPSARPYVNGVSRVRSASGHATSGRHGACSSPDARPIRAALRRSARMVAQDSSIADHQTRRRRSASRRPARAQGEAALVRGAGPDGVPGSVRFAEPGAPGSPSPRATAADPVIKWKPNPNYWGGTPPELKSGRAPRIGPPLLVCNSPRRAGSALPAQEHLPAGRPFIIAPWSRSMTCDGSR